MPEGEKNGSLLEELQVLVGNLVILLLFLSTELTQQVPGLLCFHIQTSASIPELSKSKSKENPCEIVESYFSKDLSSAYPITAALSITFPVTPSHSCLHNILAVPELPPTPLYHLLCKQQPVSWLFELHVCRLVGWLAKPKGGRRDAQSWVHLSSNYPLSFTNPADTSFRNLSV